MTSEVKPLAGCSFRVYQGRNFPLTREGFLTSQQVVSWASPTEIRHLPPGPKSVVAQTPDRTYRMLPAFLQTEIADGQTGDLQAAFERTTIWQFRSLDRHSQIESAEVVHAETGERIVFRNYDRDCDYAPCDWPLAEITDNAGTLRGAREGTWNYTIVTAEKASTGEVTLKIGLEAVTVF